MIARISLPLPADVRKATYLGSHCEHSVATEFGELFITQAVRAEAAPNHRVHIVFKPERLAIV